MDNMTFSLHVPPEFQDYWAARGVIVTAVSDAELEAFASLLLAYQTLELNLRTLRTLKEVLETKGANSDDILKTIILLLEPTRQATDQIAYLVRILEHSVHSPRPTEVKGMLQ